MKPPKILVAFVLLLFILLKSATLMAQETASCKKLTDSLTGKLIFKNTEVKATPTLGQEQMSMNLRSMLPIQEEDYDAHGMFDKTLVAGFIVNPEGNILGERILKSSGINRLDSLYLDALKHFKWNPGKCLDKNLNTWVEFKMMLYKKK